MISWQIMDTIKTPQNPHPQPLQQLRYTQIDNYYGAHKNFKTDFRNKKYKNVYMQLIHRKPAQPEHKALYFQDLLISIIKMLEVSCLGKEAHAVGPIEPFFHFGTKAISEFYWLFLRERRIIDHQMSIDPTMSSKISNFLTLIIDFCCKIAQYLRANGNVNNSERIFEECYENIVRCVINSSTSSVFLLKKCGQFLLQYASHCLATEKIGKAHQLLKDGLKAQLNQLILLKYDQKRNHKPKKFSKKYSSCLKSLSHFYISLAMVYEKENKIYECAISVLDAVLMEEYISLYRTKAKKWICNLEESYLEDKNRYLEVKRVCDCFFGGQEIREIKRNSLLTEEKNKKHRPQKSQISNKRHKNIHIAPGDAHLIFFNDSKVDADGYGKDKTKNNKTKRNEKSVKEVRFKFNDEEIGADVRAAEKQSQKEKQGNKENIINKSSPRIRISKLSLPQELSLNLMQFLEQKFDMKSTRRKSLCRDEQNNQQPKISSNNILMEEQKPKIQQIQVSIQRTKNKSKSLSRKSIQYFDNNQFFLFGENFWQTKQMTKRSKSNFEKVKNRHDYEVKRVGRKLSYNNISYLDINLNKNRDDKSKKCNQYLKESYGNFGGNLRKKTNQDRALFLQKKQQKPQQLQQVDKKISQWHKKSQKMQTDLITKLGRLRQRKITKNGQQIAQLAECMSTQRSEEEGKQFALSKIEHNLQFIRKKRMTKKNKKIGGVTVFKQFLLENKGFFNITKTDFFSNLGDQESQKRYLSFLVAEKPEKIQKFIQKNHWQAKNNVQFFMRDIQNSNKKLSRSSNKKSKWKLVETTYQSPACEQYCEVTKLSSLEIQPSNLFGTSLKSRAQQMVKLL